MRIDSKRRWIIGLGLAWCCLSGCATLQFPWEKRFPKASAKNPVVQIVCLWEQAEGRDPDNMPCRGFAGQIMFLSNRNATPVEIEGDIRIYLFDNIGSIEDQAKPLRQFDFDDPSWKLHLTKSAVGPSYSVFVPYVRRGQHNAQCSLRVRLTPKNGPTIFSEVTSLPLRGPNSTPETTIVSEVISPADRVETEVQQSLARVMQKSSTIPISITQSGGMSIDQKRTAELRGREPAASSTADQRLARMEQALERFLTKQEELTRGDGASSGVQQANYETLVPVPTQQNEEPHRYRLDRSE